MVDVFSFLRRKTPAPVDRKVFNMGIQEREQNYFMTAPVIYHIAQQSVILRTCTTQLKNEIFRRGVKFKKSFDTQCISCGHKHENKVEECYKKMNRALEQLTALTTMIPKIKKACDRLGI